MSANASRGNKGAPMVFALIGVFVASYIVVLFIAPSPPRAVAQDNPGAQLYNERCGSCHQANGQGIPGSFPPLAGNEAAADEAYVIETIRNGLTGPIVVLGENYDTAMPPVAGVSDDDAAVIASYVVGLATGSIDPGAVPSIELGDGNADRGHALFRGSSRFESGGAACASCHTAGDIGNLGGTSLGPDLTDVYDKFGGDAGVAGWLASPPSETMRPIFDDRPLTNTELSHLVAFFEDAPNRDKPAGSIDWLTIYGVAGVLVLLGAMAVAWRGMRQTYSQKLRSRT